MQLASSQFIAEVTAHMQRLGTALAEGDIGLFILYIWPQIAALGLFVAGGAAGHRLWNRNCMDARIAGLDFTNPERVEPVCEYTGKDGTVVRAWLSGACPSFATGHRCKVFADFMNPGLVTTAATQYPLFAGGLFLMSIAALGAWQSYQLAGSPDAWLASSLQEIALTEVALLVLFILLLPLIRATEDQYKADAEKLKKTELFPFEQLSEVEDRIGKFRRSLRNQKIMSFGLILFAALIFYTGATGAAAYYRGETVMARVTEYMLLPGEARYEKPVNFPARWTSPSGQGIVLHLALPSGLLARKAYAPGTEVPVRLDPKAAIAKATAYRYAFAEVDCGPVVIVMQLLLNTLAATLVLAAGICLRPPQA